MVMVINKWVIFAISLMMILILVAFISYANTIYGPAPTPMVYTTYVITMNLTDSRPSIQFLNAILNNYPLTYREDSLITNTTPVWKVTANREFTLYIINASVTTNQQAILLNTTAITNNTGGISWTLKIPSYLVYPQSVYANWDVLITEDLNGVKYVVFAFETGNESLAQVLSGLSTVGGYLVALNGEPYYLWNYYYGYNPATDSVGKYYEVSLPGLSIFMMWVGQGENASSWPSAGFQEVLQILSYSFSEYVNSSLIIYSTLSPNITIGEITNYGYTVYQRPRLVPFGPIIYVSPIVLLPNGTLINPTCIPNTYYLLQVNYVTQGGYSIPIYETKNYPMGLYLLNESLLFGGYLQAYDFFNRSVIPVTPVQYLSPIYQPRMSTVSWCKLQVFQVPGNGDILSNQTINGVINGNDTITVNNNIDINKVNAQNTIYILNVLSHVMNGFLKLLRLIVR